MAAAENLDLVALGTICDVVPLIDLNRAFVYQGIQILKKRKNIGIKTLIDVADIKESPDTYHIGFLLGPRINAGGRIGQSDLGANLLTTQDPKKSYEIATMGARLATRGPSADNGNWQAAATQRATALIYSTLEPFSLIPAHHAELNRQVALVNADTRLLLRRARIPVLDSHALMVGRSGCSADGAHWAGLAQRPRVRLLLSVGARIGRHVRLQKSAAQPASVVSVGERMKQLRRAMVEVLRSVLQSRLYSDFM